LIRQKEVLDELRHDIKIHEHNLASFAEEHPIAVDHVYFTDHLDFRRQSKGDRRQIGILSPVA
jgi:hypothetical protein